MRIGRDNGGSMTLEYTTEKLREGEAFIVFIDSVEVLKEEAGHDLDMKGLSKHSSKEKTFELGKGDHLIQFSVESRIEPDLISSYWDTKDQDGLGEPHQINSQAEAGIQRITFVGASKGGAYSCDVCPVGTYSQIASYQCLDCVAGSQPTKDRTSCTPCKEGMFNNKDGGLCKNCPPFTHSRRHAKDAKIWSGKGDEQKLIMDEAATHCELDPEFHVRQTGQIYKAAHFSARHLCSDDAHLNNSNLCAGIGIIGPISDL